MSDAKAAVASTRRLEDRIEDVDELIAAVTKSFDDARAAVNTCLAMLDAKLAEADTSDFLAKLVNWEREFHKREHAAEVASGSTGSFETYMNRIDSEREVVRKRDELTKYDFDDDGKLAVERRSDAHWRVVR